MKKLGRHDKRISVNGEGAPKTEVKKVRGQAKPFLPAEVRLIDDRLLKDGSLVAIRDRALFRFALDTMLRGCDIIRLTVGEIKPGPRMNVVDEFWVRQKKTGGKVYCHLSARTQACLAAWIESYWEKYTPDDLLFGISDKQYRNTIKKLANMIGLDPKRYSGHSTRRTRSKMIYAQTKDLGAVRVLLGHRSLGATAAYLGIEQEDAAAVARSVEIE